MTRDPRDYKLDVSGIAAPDASLEPSPRPFLRVRCDCCDIQRIYRDKDGKT